MFAPVSHIRETMVKLMLPPATLQQSAPKYDCAEAGKFDATAKGSSTLGSDNHATDPSTCTFWSAVAMGALVKGGPIESVRSRMFAAWGGQPASYFFNRFRFLFSYFTFNTSRVHRHCQ